MPYARSFILHFGRAFAERIGDQNSARKAWTGPPGEWTRLMLGTHQDEGGVLGIAAKRWADENIGPNQKIFREFRKIDLMAARTYSVDANSWEFSPALLIEHENAHDVEVEAWNLATRRSQLAVLVFYFTNKADLEAKQNRVERVCRPVAADCGGLGEFLLLCAPWRFSELSWSAAEWQGAGFSKFAPIA